MLENIILTGFMGSGKTTVGLKLSYRMQRTFCDTDRMIEKMEQKTISELFSSEGEEYFREAETELLREMVREPLYTKSIISVGGGTPLREENRKLLHQLGRVIYLQASPEIIFDHLKDDLTRPLLQDADPMQRIRELLEIRRKFYEEADQIILCDDLPVDDIVEQISQL
jgi:shikimate kinase